MPSQYAQLVGTGVTLGIFHVLTGPDHLSALATLSANVYPSQAFFLGVRWGIGHSTGLLSIGVIFILISLDDNNDDSNSSVAIPQSVTNVFETLVGIFMLLLGVYGIQRALSKRSQFYDMLVLTDEGASVTTEYATTLILDDIVDTAHDVESESKPHVQLQLNGQDDDDDNDIEIQPDPSVHNSSSSNESIQSTPIAAACSKRYFSTKVVAILAGIVHGLAGPGGVLGVIPAVQLHNARLAAIYLGCFCLSSTITMGIFAVCYGYFSSVLGQRVRSDFAIEFASSCFSIIVGITWIVLLSIGKLDDVFP